MNRPRVQGSILKAIQTWFQFEQDQELNRLRLLASCSFAVFGMVLMQAKVTGTTLDGKH